MTFYANIALCEKEAGILALDHIQAGRVKVWAYKLMYGDLTVPRRSGCWTWDGRCTRAIYLLMPRRRLARRLFDALDTIEDLRAENRRLNQNHPD